MIFSLKTKTGRVEKIKSPEQTVELKYINKINGLKSLKNSVKLSFVHGKTV